MAARIKGETGRETELIRGDNGVFDVACDGELLFSKHAAGRFPEEDEILAMLR